MRWGSLPRATRAPHPQGRCLEDSGAWAAFTYCHLLPSCPGGHRQVSRRKKSGRSSSPVTAPPPGTHPPSLPASLLPPLPGVQPGSRQPMETTSSAPRPRRAGCVCVSGSLSSDPIPLPRHRDAGQDPRALHGGREREKVFYIRYLFNIPF